MAAKKLKQSKTTSVKVTSKVKPKTPTKTKTKTVAKSKVSRSPVSDKDSSPSKIFIAYLNDRSNRTVDLIKLFDVLAERMKLNRSELATKLVRKELVRAGLLKG